MKITYTLTQDDMEKIIADYMKEKYDDYNDYDHKIEVIVGYVSEW